MTDVTSAGLVALHDGLGEAAAWSSNKATQAGFALAKLANNRLFSRARFAQGELSGVELTADFGAAVTASVFMLAGHNFTLGVARAVKASLASNFSSPVVDVASGAAHDQSLGSLLPYEPPWGHLLLHVAPAAVTFRYLRWTISDPTNPDGYLEVAIPRCGVPFQPAENFGEDWRRADRVTGPLGAQKVLRGHRLKWPLLGDAESAKLATLYRGALGVRRMLVVPRPKNPGTYLGQALWSRLENSYDAEPVRRSMGRFEQSEVVFREVSR